MKKKLQILKYRIHIFLFKDLMNHISIELIDLFINEPYILSKLKERLKKWYKIHKFDIPAVVSSVKYVQPIQDSKLRSGRTTRCIDYAIQELFEKGMTTLLDPSCKQYYRAEKIVDILKKRLLNEHNMVAGRIKYEIFSADDVIKMKQHIFNPYEFSYVRKAMDNQGILAIHLKMIN